MPTEVVIRPPRLEDEAEVRCAHEELAEEDFVFAIHLANYDSYAAWVEAIAAQARGQVDSPELVPADFLLAVVAGEIAGQVSIRHRLNDGLRLHGGHIGYGVRRAFRRQGVATALVDHALERLHRSGVGSALITCEDDNLGSIAVIERFGGHLEDRVRLESGEVVRRYWVPTDRRDRLTPG